MKVVMSLAAHLWRISSAPLTLRDPPSTPAYRVGAAELLLIKVA